ncbi:MAG TPA: hypothetical protein VJ841_03540 [Candidatus Saccharimonadales bacterium]|nr:hypothetical protein [Candidatus Saccharimonadales bacterium]
MTAKYPKDKFGTHSEIDHDTETGSSTETRDEVYNGGITRRLIVDTDSVQIKDDRTIIEKILECHKRLTSGEIRGYSVNAEKYHPQTLLVNRIEVKTIRLADK